MWSSWGNWSDCSKPCGGGLETKNRTYKGPLEGGKECEGDANDTKICNLDACTSGKMSLVYLNEMQSFILHIYNILQPIF